MLALLVYSRWLLAPDYLVTFDAINFALSIRDFNPALHQPQPPGYPLFVGLLKLLSFIPDVEALFLTAAILVSAAALILVWKLGDLMMGKSWGGVAALLLVFNPPFWLSSLTNPVRLSMAMGAAAIALCAWLAVERRSPLWIVLAAVAAGLAAGFRPLTPVRMAPLLIWAAWRIGIGWKPAALAVLGFCLAVSSWLSVLLSEVGGPRHFLEMLSGYTGQQIAPASLLFGAGFHAVVDMTWKVLVWSCLGVLSWVWAVPLLRGAAPSRDGLQWRFLAMWLIPGLLFHAAFHVADPDHTVGTVVATCLAGALVLKRATASARFSLRTAAIALAVLLNVFLFLKPISKTARASTYRPVQWLDSYITDVIRGVNKLSRLGPVTVIYRESVTGWRQLSYYDPGVHIMVLRPLKSGVEVRHIRGTQMATQTVPVNAVPRPACGIIAWVDPAVRPVGKTPIHFAGSHISYSREAPRSEFDFRQYHFIPGNEACDGTAP